MEEWRPIEGFPNYQVSNLGRVMSLKYGKQKILSPAIRNHYLSVVLFKEGLGTHKDIHRLVASAFIPKEVNKTEVDHKDRDKLNNVVENLCWADRKEQNLNKDIWFRGTNTGEPYISLMTTKNCYQIRKRINGINYKRIAHTIEEAILIRDTLLSSSS